ncbi:MFS transporter [Sphingomicrobium nitratireducens]|uniref:MFS transporter n=1 Tax=Sphingomicrobium nitratireducens TaxID=2964666 RepID=UPI00223ECAA9
MEPTLKLLARRRFAPLFATQFLGAFNDNLYRTAMVLIVIYGIYADPAQEATFSAVAGGLFILPFFIFSALAGQIADSHDKAAVVRRVKTAEIVIMAVGAAGLMLQSVPLLLAMLFATGLQSTLFGPIKYAILPQHLKEGEVLGGTGLVEAGTYVAILLGIVCGGLVIVADASGALEASWGAGAVIVVALLGRFASSAIPPAPPQPGMEKLPIDWNIFRSSWKLMESAMTRPQIRLAIICISFFWAMGTLLAAQFPPLVKNALGADQTVATAFLAAFSVGVAAGSIAVNLLLKGKVSARFSPASALLMGLFVLDLYRRVIAYDSGSADLVGLADFAARPQGIMIFVDLFFVAMMGGMYVVPLYAYLTTHVPPSETARTVAANNIVNSGLMVAASLLLAGAIQNGVGVADTLFVVVGATIISAGLGWRLEKADRALTPGTD